MARDCLMDACIGTVRLAAVGLLAAPRSRQTQNRRRRGEGEVGGRDGGTYSVLTASRCTDVFPSMHAQSEP